MTEQETLARRGEESLAAHAAGCEDCHTLTPPLAAIARNLAAYVVPISAAALSQRVMLALRPELARLASVWFWRRLARITLAALLPLPAVLWLDAYILRAFYDWASELLPAVLVGYLVLSYAAMQLLLVAATYAAIPLVLAREAWVRSVGPAEVLP